MSSPVVKVRSQEFQSFLEKHKDVATLWVVATNEQFAETSFGNPCTVDELMTEIEIRGGDSEFIYVYNENIDNPIEEWDQTKLQGHALQY
jgi:hypothetical protein